MPLTALTNGMGTAAMPAVPTNSFFLYDGNTDTALPSVMNLGSATQMATMPDWSPDGKSVVFVIPQMSATWDMGGRGGRGARQRKAAWRQHRPHRPHEYRSCGSKGVCGGRTH